MIQVFPLVLRLYCRNLRLPSNTIPRFLHHIQPAPHFSKVTFTKQQIFGNISTHRVLMSSNLVGYLVGGNAWICSFHFEMSRQGLPPWALRPLSCPCWVLSAERPNQPDHSPVSPFIHSLPHIPKVTFKNTKSKNTSQAL